MSRFLWNYILLIVASGIISNSLVLLYVRGAELSWQGRPLQPTEDTLQVSVSEVACSGSEAALSACHLEPGHQCLIARDAVGVRCYKNWVSQCQPGEVNHGKKCYSLVVPSEHHALEGFTHGEALRDCQARGSQLLDITSQVRGYISFIHKLNQTKKAHPLYIQVEPSNSMCLPRAVSIQLVQKSYLY